MDPGNARDNSQTPMQNTCSIRWSDKSWTRDHVVRPSDSGYVYVPAGIYMYKYAVVEVHSAVHSMPMLSSGM